MLSGFDVATIINTAAPLWDAIDTAVYIGMAAAVAIAIAFYGVRFVRKAAR